MIMDLPEKFSIGDARQKNDAFIEDGILKIRKNASYHFVIFELTFELKGGKHICRYCGKYFSDKKMTMDHMYPQGMAVRQSLIIYYHHAKNVIVKSQI